MKNCFACGNVQDAGNFCAKCGGTLTEVSATNDGGAPTPSQPTGQFGQPVQPGQPAPNFQQQGPNYQQPPFGQQGQPFGQQQFQQHDQGQQYQQQQYQQQYQQYQQAGPAQPNVHVERVKDQSKMFFNFFTTYLKQPSSIFGTGERQFTNGLISIIAYALLIGLSLFIFVSTAFGGFIDTGAVFFNVFGGSAIFIIAIFAVIVLSLFIVAKGFGPDTSWKEIISLLGTLSIPSIILSILSMLLFIVKSYDFGYWMFLISLLLVISAIPLYIITRLLTMRSKSLDSFYAYLVYIVIFSVLFYVLITVVWNNTAGKFIGGYW
ncbi:hypothetical protein [Ureibacillus manganicus]|uniref:Yip1 domain-containing protein n=1 Tax=Ureibacillus manganicus DSM 26584 TaxID=1384049 RepID=A0A0A3HY98_9BACL|nr:hypothetical protein [Ureibacillus manganicus]KGR76210.1 hypothetical protein CD29_17150 [Ureibacillus manganicus DSM 26584]